GDQQDDPDRVDVDPRDVGLDRERQDGAQHHQKDANPDAHPSPSIRAACTTLYDPEPVTDVTTRSPAVEVPRPPAPRCGGRHDDLRRPGAEVVMPLLRPEARGRPGGAVDPGPTRSYRG